jgi:hypothetical protein
MYLLRVVGGSSHDGVFDGRAMNNDANLRPPVSSGELS